jgi:hypothetical protein
LTVAAGGSVTISAIVDTSLKNVPVPTGTVPFIYWGPMSPVAGNETYSATTDSNGNVALRASLTFVPGASTSIAATYNGDSNYPSAAGGGLVDITVTGSDFALVPSLSSLTINPGGGGVVLLYVQGQSSYSGTINFSSTSCSGLPRESTCSFNPASVTGAGYTGLTLSTIAPHAFATKLERNSRYKGLIFALSLPFTALLLIGTSRRRTWRGMAVCILGGGLLVGLGCGGGSNGGGGGGGGNTDPGTPPGSYVITVTATSGSFTHSTAFTLVVQ